MPTRLLTARFVEHVKPIAARVEYFDAKVSGLALRVAPSGSKTWTLLYRHRARLRRFTLGSAAVIPLADARERANELLNQASKGADPATAKQDGRRAETIGDLATLYIEEHAKPKKRSWKADDNLLRRKVLPVWRRRAILDIKRSDVLALVQQVAKAGAPIVANRVAALLSKMFAFALDNVFDARGKPLLETSPAVKIPRPGQEHARDRVLTEDELRTLWPSVEKLEATMGAFYKLRLLTAQRGGEVASMRWQDVELEAGWWTIPGTITKNKLAHRVPLSASAVRMLATLMASAPKDAVYVLAGARGKRQQAEAAAMFTVSDFRGHDLRRTAASFMTSGGVPRLVVSKILNHVEAGVTRVYDRHSYDGEKRAALDWWAAKLQSTLEPKDAGKVLPFAKGA